MVRTRVIALPAQQQWQSKEEGKVFINLPEKVHRMIIANMKKIDQVCLSLAK